MIDRFGTHNLLDGAAEAKGFAKVVLFTEAPPNIFADRVNNCGLATKEIEIAVTDVAEGVGGGGSRTRLPRAAATRQWAKRFSQREPSSARPSFPSRPAWARPRCWSSPGRGWRS